MALEGVISSSVSSLLEMAVSRVTGEFMLFWGFKKDIIEFRKELEMIQALLSSVDESSSVSPAMKVWLNKVLDLGYKSQDFMDELAYENYRRKLELKNRLKKLHNFFRRSNPIMYHFRMAHRMADLNVSIAKIRILAHDIGVSSVEARGNHSQNRSHYNLQQVRDLGCASIMVGRATDKSILVEKLCSISHTGNDSFYVLAVVGLSGLGKTTLAKHVYDAAILEKVFAKKFWVTVSREFDIPKILAEMLLSITGKRTGAPSNADGIIRELQDHLSGRRYFIVLDDLWNTDINMWHTLKNSFQKIGEGVLLVTTRDTKVANVMQASFIHPLSKLSNMDSWLLFSKIAFNGRSVEDVQKLSKVGSKIVSKCHGVPLAIISVAGLLSLEKEVRQWRKIEKNELWSLPLGDTGILPSLKLSYIYLPSTPLKQCFTFLAFYGKGDTLRKENFIQMWVAHGYLDQYSSGSNLLEDIGEEFCTALSNISFLLVYNNDDLGNATRFRMHDLIHDLALSINDEHLQLKDSAVHDASSVRHLKLLKKPIKALSELPESLHLKKLRSLRSIHELPPNMLHHTRKLRVLDLSDSDLEEVPDSIGGLKCLKYLNLSFTKVKTLPESITQLYNLQTLRLRECNRLTALPMGLRKLVNLRHLRSTKHMRAPQGINDLLLLQTAPFFELTASNAKSFQIHELGGLSHLGGILSIKGLQHVNTSEEAKATRISNKDRLDSLELIWSSERVETSSSSGVDVLEALQPHENLKSLKVQGFDGGEFPGWLLDMSVFDAESGEDLHLDNLANLELFDCKRIKELPKLGQLLSLQILRLQRMASVETIGSPLFYDCDNDNGDNEASFGDPIRENSIGESSQNIKVYFPLLREFIIDNLPSLKEWLPPSNFQAKLFARLEVLKIIRCPKLVAVPEADFSCLRHLIVEKIYDEMPLLTLIENCCRNSSFVSLTSLIIKGVEQLRYLPEDLLLCQALRELRIQRCKNLRRLPVGLNRLVSLEVLELAQCSDYLVTFPDISGLVSLHQLKIANCGGLTSPPSGLKSCKSLRILELTWCRHMNISDLLSTQLRSIEILSICGLRNMTHLLEGLQELKYLRGVQVGGFGNFFVEFPGINHLANIQSLKMLRLYGWDRLQSLPEELQHLTALQVLHVVGFKSIEGVPEWFEGLSSLEDVVFTSCRNLKVLPDTLRRLQKLRSLKIENCMLLKERCAKNTGSEWPKIHHIRKICIDGEVIQDL